MNFRTAALALTALLSSTAAHAEGFLKVEGTEIVDGSGKPVILRGMGLGGWMLQEGYMLKLGEVGQQHKIRARLVELVGEERTAAFYREGNCWGNNYKGLPPAWDANMVLSFHKYWNRNDAASIAEIKALRTSYNRPIWLGESGENSNGWYRDAIALVEGDGIGWNFWPLKKIGFNQPLEIVAGDGWMKIVAWMTGKGPKPGADEAYAAMMQLAENTRFDKNIPKPDVIDAMFRQPRDASYRPFAARTLGAKPLAIAAADYDLGPPGVAYHDSVDANYHVATGGERTPWNNGTTYRNDGVDIARGADGTPYVSDFVTGEYMRYSANVAKAGRWTVAARARSAKGGRIGIDERGVAIPAGTAWQVVKLADVDLPAGPGAATLRAIDCGDCEVAELFFTPR